MAVEATHLNLFPSQFIPNREIMMNLSPFDATMNLYNNNTHMGNYSSVLPLSGTTTTTASEILLPPVIADSLPQRTNAVLESDVSTLTSVQRKRSRDSIKSRGTFSFLGEDISLHFHHQQLHLDNLISQHMEKMRVELEEKRKRHARRLTEAIEVGVMKRLKAKEEEIERIGKLNLALEERVKSLSIENQIWRDLAQTNEATANALRTNLEQVLAQVRDDDGPAATDAESCCGSTDDGWRTVAEDAQDKEGNDVRRRLCRKCGKEESCVLILPCRHLCLCTVCGSTLHTCPVCNSFKNASLHVNIT